MNIESEIDSSINATTGIDIDPLSQQSPFSEMPQMISDGARIEAESFDLGGQDVAYYDLDSFNQGNQYRPDEGVDIETTMDDGGGYNVGWVEDGEWLEYTTKVTEGTYNVKVRVASEISDPGSLQVKLDDELLGTVDVTGTGGWQNWQTLTIEGVELTGSEEQLLRLEIQDAGQFNLNWLEFESVNNSSNNSPESEIDPSSSADDNLPWLQADGKWIEDEAGNPVTLRGMSFAGFNNNWGEKALPDFQEKISEVTNENNGWYPNLLRLPIKDYHLNDFSLEETYQTLKAGVDEAVEQDVYVIIDWHVVDGEKGTDWQSPEMDNKTKEFWSYMAPRFKDYSNVMFEVYNEPGYPKAVTEENWLAWRDKAQEWVDLIREQAPENLILISSPLWSQITQFAPKYPFEGSNLAYVNHTYPGMEESWPRDVGMEYDWEEVFGKAADHVPIFITEFGWQDTEEAWELGKGTISDFGQPMKDFLSNRPNINWTIWTYDHYASPALVDANGKPREGEGEMGEFVQDWLQEEWAKPTNPVK